MSSYGRSQNGSYFRPLTWECKMNTFEGLVQDYMYILYIIHAHIMPTSSRPMASLTDPCYRTKSQSSASGLRLFFPPCFSNVPTQLGLWPRPPAVFMTGLFILSHILIKHVHLFIKVNLPAEILWRLSRVCDQLTKHFTYDLFLTQ